MEPTAPQTPPPSPRIAALSIWAIVLGANMAAVYGFNFMSELFYPQQHIDVYIALFEPYEPYLSLFVYLVPTTACLAYIWPALGPKFSRLNHRAKMRLLNAPLMVSLLGVSGWLVGLLVDLFLLMVVGNSLTWQEYTPLMIDVFIRGLFAFVLAFHLAEFVSRRHLVPRWFPEGQLSRYRGVVNLSIRGRFIIYYFAVGFFPVALFARFLMTLEQSNPGLLDLGFLLSILGLFLLVGVLLTHLMVRVLANPVTQMHHAAHAIGLGEFDVKLEVVSSDELGHLAEGINLAAEGLKERRELVEVKEVLEQRVAEELEKNRKKDQLMVQQSKLAAVGEMIGLIAHQWRQPLSAISSMAASIRMALLKDAIDPERFEAYALDINDQVQYLSRTIDDFRNFFKPGRPKEEVFLDKLVQQTLSIIGKSLEYHQIEFKLQLSLRRPVRTWANELMQVLLNLLKNSKDAIVGADPKQRWVRVTGWEAEGWAVLEISDSGPGLSPEALEHLFDPYFTTKGDQQGTGLGLYMSRMIVEDRCGGRLEAKNGEPGAVITLYLPLEEPEHG